MKRIKREFLSKAWVLPWVDLGVWSKGQISTFSEHGHIVYQIKGNHICNNVVANILPADPTHPHPTPLRS